jgi:hypothetical protein
MIDSLQLEQSPSCVQPEKSVTTPAELTIKQLGGASRQARYEQTQKARNRRARYRARLKEERIASQIARCPETNKPPVILRVGMSEADVALDALLVNAFQLPMSPKERLLADLWSRISSAPRKDVVFGFDDDEPLFFIRQQLSVQYPRVLGGPKPGAVPKLGQQIKLKPLRKTDRPALHSDPPFVRFPSRVWGGERLRGFVPAEVKTPFDQHKTDMVRNAKVLQQAAVLGGAA